jgi:hypothetical protein
MKVYLENNNGVMDELAKHVELVPLARAERVVLWNDYMHAQIQVIKQAQVPVIMVQNGRMDNYYPYNRLYKDYPFLADRICVWGTGDVEDLAAAGVPREKIFVTGTTMYRPLYQKPHKDFTVVFVPCHDKEWEEANRLVTRQLQSAGYRIITKITSEQPARDFINPVISNRFAADHLQRCADALAEADVVLSNDITTFELLAHYLKVPVVRKAEEIAHARYDEAASKKLLEERGQYNQALERMLAAIQA